MLRRRQELQRGDNCEGRILDIGTNGERWVQACDGLQPSSVLRNVGPVAVYGPFLEMLVNANDHCSLLRVYGARVCSSRVCLIVWRRAALKRCGALQVDTVDDVSAFAYDWRRDNNESADRFISYLEQIKQRHAGRPAQVVAHSNGGERLKTPFDVLFRVDRLMRTSLSFSLSVSLSLCASLTDRACEPCRAERAAGPFPLSPVLRYVSNLRYRFHTLSCTLIDTA